MSATREATAALRVPSPLEPANGKLSPGPGMTPQAVASNQRGRICGAMIELAGEHGYSAVTVRELSRLASVSTRTFYEHFRDKEDCALSAIDFVIRRAAAEIHAAQDDAGDWQERLGQVLTALAREVADKPRAGRLVLIAPYSIGPLALERLSRAESVSEAMVGEDFAGGADAPPLLAKGIVAGLSRATRSRLLCGREDELPALVDVGRRWVASFRDEAISELRELDHRRDDGPAIGEAATPTPHVDDRALILKAVAKLAAAEGYERLTVPRIRVAAGVSRKSFNAEFRGVGDCFLAAVELRTAAALERAAELGGEGCDWPVDVYRTLSAFCGQVARDPLLAKLAFVEVFAPGPDGVRSREAIIGTAAELFASSAPESQRPSGLAAEASAGAVWGVIHHFAALGRAWELPRTAATLSFLMLAPAIGAPAAVAAIRRGQERD